MSVLANLGRLRFVACLIPVLCWPFLCATPAQAGGPKYVAGASFFDPAVKGTPLTWDGGSIQYYTDQGDLSQILTGAAADALVAEAFSRWESVPTAALAVARAGQLAENVSGDNVISHSGGSISMPDDILPTAIDKPIAVVYDYDGKVVDALLGRGAGDDYMCFSNAVLGGPDSFGSDGHMQHALIVINGNCALAIDKVPEVKYRLMRVIGQVLGLDWSQLNLNVITGNPAPTSDDFDGYPVMHSMDLISCVPITACYSTPDEPKEDDRAAISRLYPVTDRNQGQFPGRMTLEEDTARIYGSVYFPDGHGGAAQPMQGVNVVARWIDPVRGLPSRKYAASAVSGALFRGRAGNPVTGPLDALGQRYDRFGSDDPELEGAFELAGLEIPNGDDSGQFQLTVEPVDANYSAGVGPYAPWQIPPSGSATPITVTVERGGAVRQDVIMQGAAVYLPDWGEPDTYQVPGELPGGGDWSGWLGEYGDSDYFKLHGEANRTLSVIATALDQSGQPTDLVMRPVIGIWDMADPEGTLAPAWAPTFNTGLTGTTRLNASLLAHGDFRIGITDERGDGRPDLRFHARVLYADTVSPKRLSMRQTSTLQVGGMGFASGLAAKVGSATTPILSTTSTEVLISSVIPAHDSVQGITLTEAATGAETFMADVLTFGAGPNDILQLLQGGNPAVPIGGETPTPIRVAVLQEDGSTPVNGASVNWSTTSGTLSACAGASSCTVYTDESGEVSTRLTVTQAVTSTITAELAPGAYDTSRKVRATVVGTTSSLDIALASQYLWVAEGASVDLPLTARVLSNGIAQNGRTVNYQIEAGSGTLTAANAMTNTLGYATVTLQLRSLSGEVQVSACVAPSNSPCKTFYLGSVAASSLQLQMLSGSGQLLPVGQSFQSVTLRVTDSSALPNPVQGAVVAFNSTISRPGPDIPTQIVGDEVVGHHAMPVILGSDHTDVTSGADGKVSVVPSPGRFSGAVSIMTSAATGSTASLVFGVQSFWPASPVVPSIRAAVTRGTKTLRERKSRARARRARGFE